MDAWIYLGAKFKTSILTTDGTWHKSGSRWSCGLIMRDFQTIPHKEGSIHTVAKKLPWQCILLVQLLELTAKGQFYILHLSAFAKFFLFLSNYHLLTICSIYCGHHSHQSNLVTFFLTSPPSLYTNMFHNHLGTQHILTPSSSAHCTAMHYTTTSYMMPHYATFTLIFSDEVLWKSWRPWCLNSL